jgi:DNA-binding protein HU-beta
LSRDFKAFLEPPRERGRIARAFSVHLTKERAVNKAELIAALAMRTKMSKADAGRAIESLFDDKGIIAGELKKGTKVQITGFGNFEARKRAARMGRNPKTGAEIQIKATIAPAFRAGKQLKMAVNNKK